MVSLMIVMTLPLHTTSAANHALLVGVADYPSLAAKFQLQGPSNDVALMRAVLAARDFLPENITTLVSGGETPPTRAAILIALERLAQRAERGDFVYLHLAGHGSQQPSGVDDTDETDGLDEIFLPQDVGQWEDKIGAVNKAIVDNEIRSHIAAIRTKGAFVWAVFDSCHSGTMLRAARRTRFRNVDAAALGVPEQGRRGHQRRGEAVPMGVDRLGEDAGGFIAFYAAQAFEPAPELTMPIDGAVAKPHGLFSYSLAEALANGGGMSYRQLGEAILQKYASLRIFRTTPLFEGTHLDAPIYGTRAGPAVRQWKLVLRGSKSKPMAYVRAGELQQIGTGSVFALLTDPLAADEEAIDYAQARDIELFGSRLEPLASAERAPPDVTKLSKNLYARLVKPVFQFDLKVAMPADGSALGARERDTLTAIKTLAANRPSTIDEGLKINWVTAAEEADLYLSFTPRQDAQDCPRDHLWFLNRTGGLVCDGARRTLSLRIEQPSANFMRNLQTQLL
ncbi:MAG: caspase family protein, partial [bacterium]|nr:caspase family protein [bacterium]